MTRQIPKFSVSVTLHESQSLTLLPPLSTSPLHLINQKLKWLQSLAAVQ